MDGLPGKEQKAWGAFIPVSCCKELHAVFITCGRRIALITQLHCIGEKKNKVNFLFNLINQYMLLDRVEKPVQQQISMKQTFVLKTVL